MFRVLDVRVYDYELNLYIADVKYNLLEYYYTEYYENYELSSDNSLGGFLGVIQTSPWWNI